MVAEVDSELREIPIVLHPRGGESKLDKVRDGLRGLRLIVSSRDGRRGR